MGVLSQCLDACLQLLPFIIGRGGNTKKQLEQETGTTLHIPKGGRWRSPALLAATATLCVPAKTTRRVRVSLIALAFMVGPCSLQRGVVTLWVAPAKQQAYV